MKLQTRQRGAIEVAIVIALVVLVAIGGLFGYLKQQRSGSNPSPTPTATGTGIMGRVLVGPTCPVMREDDPMCADRPYQGDFIVRDATNLRVVGHFSTNLYGYFSISLEPGTYTIESVQRIGISKQVQTIVVHAGAMTQATLTFDTGIR